MLQKLPPILTIVYLILVVLSIIPIFTGDDALSGIFAIVLTVPWSSILSNLLPGSGSVAVGLLVVAVKRLMKSVLISETAQITLPRICSPDPRSI